jgi:hypothetical protein
MWPHIVYTGKVLQVTAWHYIRSVWVVFGVASSKLLKPSPHLRAGESNPTEYCTLPILSLAHFRLPNMTVNT